jgi:hypothetical protein
LVIDWRGGLVGVTEREERDVEAGAWDVRKKNRGV